jgi:nitrite reductase/ring-hydroxylating ferredoxin subunit
MTTREENDRLTQTGPGTPAGNLLRRYWQPVALASELADDTPLPVRIMSEDLVLFRDDHGNPGLLGLLCPHRCADLSYGRIEDGGLRCLYHGWLFDRAGRCLEMPAEPAESNYKDRIRHTAYPCREAAGVIFAYMGPGEPPLFPGFHFLSAPPDHVHQSKLHHTCNFLQANEGNIDPAHLSFLHSFKKPLADRSSDAQKAQRVMITNSRPVIDAERTRFGIRIYSERSTDDGRKYVRLTNFVFPNLGFFSGEGGQRGPGGYSVHWHVPIDDVSHWRYDFVYHAREKLDKAALIARSREEIDENYYPTRTAANRYRQSRAEMKEFSFSGMGTWFPGHDMYAVHTPGAIHDRTREHLATTDIVITQARRMLLDGMKAIEEGHDPPLSLRETRDNVFPDIVVTGQMIDAGTDRRDFAASLVTAGDFHQLK